VYGGVLTAGEYSSDRLGGPVLAELRRRRPELTWRGIAGPELREAGLQPLGDVADLGITGLAEALPGLPAAWRAHRTLRAAMRTAPLAVTIDSPDLHLRLLRGARRAGCRTVQLVAPQFWVWRAGRAKQLADGADLALCLWPFEVPLLRAHGCAAFCVGHPAVDRPMPARTASKGLRVLLLPGSRGHEIERHLPMFRAALAGIEHRATLVWAGVDKPVIDGVEVLTGPLHEHLDVDLVLVAAGTATLEVALAGVPQIAVASGTAFTQAVARMWLRRAHYALPNILLGRAAVPEIHGLELAPLAAAVRAAVDGLPGRRAAAEAVAEELRALLPPPGFAARVVDRLEPMLP